jgi:hypothetical protein
MGLTTGLTMGLTMGLGPRRTTTISSRVALTQEVIMEETVEQLE